MPSSDIGDHDWQRDAMRAGGIGVWRWEIAAGFSFWSADLAAVFGLPEETLGDTDEAFLGLLNPDDRTAFVAAVERALDHNEELRVEFRPALPQDPCRWFEAIGQVVLDEQGQPLRMIGSIRDVTGRRRAEEALRLSEAKYSTIYHTSPNSITLCRLNDGTYIEVNQGFTQITGYTSDEAVGASAFALGIWNDPGDHARLQQALAEAGEVRDWELTFIHKNSTSWIGLLSARVIEVNNEPCMLALTRDITEHKRAEQALRDSEETFRTIFEESPYPLSISSMDGRFINVNRAYLRGSGYTREELLGRTAREAGQLHDPADEARLHAMFMRDGQLDEVEVDARRRDDSESTILVSVRAVRLGGKPAALTLIQDISQRKQAEDALRAREEHFRALIEQGMDVILIVDPSGVIQYESPSVTRVLGYEVAELLGRNALDFLHPDDVAATQDALARLSASPEEIFQADFRIRHADGTWRHIEASGRSRIHVPGIAGIIINARDITERKQAEEQTQRQVRHLRGLRSIDMAITASADLRFTLEVVMDQTAALLGAEGAAVLLTSPQTQGLEQALWHSVGHWASQGETEKFQRALAEEAIRQRHLISSDTIVQSSSFPGQWLYFLMPLIAKGRVQGVLAVCMARPFAADAEWIGMLETLAGQAAIAVDNATLFDDLQRSNQELMLAYDATIEGWSRALDLRDRETEGHTLRVMDLTLRLARAMHMKDVEMIHIRRGALLHDIGKMGVPDAILLKPGPLTEAEWAIMRQHPTYAFEMLAPIEFLRPALSIPYCHHEKWDGTGYPRGLSGEQIPFAARLFAVVDVWDALRSDRVYRPAVREEAARKHLQDQSGHHFEPRIVEAFLHLLGQ